MSEVGDVVALSATYKHFASGTRFEIEAVSSSDYATIYKVHLAGKRPAQQWHISAQRFEQSLDLSDWEPSVLVQVVTKP
jgi:hypothetical protein